MVCFFFFSSRRRHTRWPRDWSSDVCSSDLCDGRRPAAGRCRRRCGPRAEAAARDPGPEDAAALVDQIEVLLRDLPPVYAEVLGLRLEGHTVSDIAPRLGDVGDGVALEPK